MKKHKKAQRGPLDPLFELMEGSRPFRALAALGTEEPYAGAFRAVPADQQAGLISRVRRRFLWSQAAYVALFLIVATATLMLWLLMTIDVRAANSAIDHEPRHTTTISRIVETDEDIVEYVDVSGRERRLHWDWTIFAFKDILAVRIYDEGQKVTVVIDPEAPAMAYDVETHRVFGWGDALGGLLLIWAVASLIRRRLTRNWMMPDRSRWQLMRQRIVTNARVLEVRGKAPRRFEKTRRVLDTIRDVVFDSGEETFEQTLVVEIDGRPYAWDIRTEEPVEIPVGAEFPVWGRPRHRGWVVGLTGPALLYPRSPLD